MKITNKYSFYGFLCFPSSFTDPHERKSELPMAMAMAMAMATLFITLSLIFSTTLAEIRLTEIKSDNRPIIPLDEFGFTDHGSLELSVSKISLSNPSPYLDLSKIGFFLCTHNSWVYVRQQIQISCSLQPHFIQKLFTFQSLNSSSFSTLYNQSHAPDQYTLLFANCLHLNISMTVKSAMYNLHTKTNTRDYLSAGKTILPTVYFLFSLIFFILAAYWIYVLYKKRLTVYGIHFFMLAVLILKTSNLLCEAEDYSYIKRMGTAHGWDVLFYIFSFFKGITLFTFIGLIGTGWSFLKPYLQDKEKKVLIIVIPLQVIANIVRVVIDETGPFGQDWITWRHIFLLVDVVCCCAVLFPILWSIKNLREAAQTDGNAAFDLMKLKLFRHYYIVVICYIYFTRVVVYALETITSYKYLWTSVVAGELATLAFYVFTGFRFKPEARNPYFVIDDEEEEAAVENEFEP